MTLKIEQMKRPRIRPFAFKIVNTGLHPWGGRSNDTQILEMIEWVILNIGTLKSNKWEIRGYGPSAMNVYFSNEEDASSFKLRWL